MKTILNILIIVVLASCSSKMSETYNSKLEIQNCIIQKTDIKLDTNKFTIILDSIHNTAGAFDLDYSWFVKLKFENSYFEKLKETIRSTPNYCVIEHEYSKSWDNIDTSKVKGVWTIDSVYIKYYRKRGDNAEPIILSIDTVTKVLDFELIHL